MNFLFFYKFIFIIFFLLYKDLETLNDLISSFKFDLIFDVFII